MPVKPLHLAFAALFLFAACRKKDPPPVISPIWPSYSRMAPGNYWIYEVYTMDSARANAAPLGIIDSMYVEKDTVIRGQTYHVFREPETPGQADYSRRFLRDSLHYIIDDWGNIYFSSQDLTTVFRDEYLLDPGHMMGTADTVGRMEVKMAEKDRPMTVPAGTFTTTSRQTTWYMHPSFGGFAPLVRRLYTRYSPQVGRVSETLPFYASNPDYRERRLIRYHVQ